MHSKPHNIKNSTNKNTGFQFQVGEERLTISQIAKRAGCSSSYANKCLRQLSERPEHFIRRVIKQNTSI